MHNGRRLCIILLDSYTRDCLRLLIINNIILDAWQIHCYETPNASDSMSWLNDRIHQSVLCPIFGEKQHTNLWLVNGVDGCTRIVWGGLAHIGQQTCINIHFDSNGFLRNLASVHAINKWRERRKKKLFNTFSWCNSVSLVVAEWRMGRIAIFTLHTRDTRHRKPFSMRTNGPDALIKLQNIANRQDMWAIKMQAKNCVVVYYF